MENSMPGIKPKECVCADRFRKCLAMNLSVMNVHLSSSHAPSTRAQSPDMQKTFKNR